MKKFITTLLLLLILSLAACAADEIPPAEVAGTAQVTPQTRLDPTDTEKLLPQSRESKAPVRAEPAYKNEPQATLPASTSEPMVVTEAPAATSPPEVEFPPVRLSDARWLSDTNTGSGKDITYGDWYDFFGSLHYDSIKFWVIDRIGMVNTESVDYAIDGQYKILSGNIVAGNDSDVGA